MTYFERPNISLILAWCSVQHSNLIKTLKTMGESLETGHNHFYALLWTHGGMASLTRNVTEPATYKQH